MGYWADGELAQRISETYNDALARAHERYPKRLVGLATLPMHEPALALKEVERAAKLPGLRGFYIATQIRGKDLSDASFLPVYERIEASGLPLFLHPVEVIGHERLGAYYLTNLLGNPFESAIAAAHLIFGGVLDRLPKLVVCLPHAGGAFPWLVGRLNRGWEKRTDLKHVKRSPIEYLRRFYYDTVGYSDHVLEYLVKVIGADYLDQIFEYVVGVAHRVVVEAAQVLDRRALDVLQIGALFPAPVEPAHEPRKGAARVGKADDELGKPVEHTPKDEVRGGDRRLERVAEQVGKVVGAQTLVPDHLDRVQDKRQSALLDALIDV